MKQRQVKLKFTLEQWNHLFDFIQSCYHSMLQEKGGLDLVLKIATLEKYLIRLSKQITSWNIQGIESQMQRQMTLDWTEYLILIDCSDFEMDNYVNMIFQYVSQKMPAEISQKISAGI